LLLTSILFLIVLIMLNAFFAASEIALISLNDNKIRLLANEGNKKAILIKKLLGEPSKFLAAIQIGITLAGFLASAFASESFADSLAGLIKNTGIPFAETTLKTISMIVITLILSYFTLVLGELVPKRLAMKKAERISMIVAGPLKVLLSVTSPFVKLLALSTNFLVGLFGVNPHEEDEKITEEEIRMMVDLGGEKGTIHESEKEMINNIFEFDNKTAADIMTHRTNITAIPINASLNEVISAINKKKYTRIPVYEGSIDNITGILHVKDLMQYAAAADNNTSFGLREITRQPYYVHSSKRTDQLFKEMQKNRIHMAVIIDEYGGTAGIVTIEDLIEEIVGNIFDEYDIEERDFEKMDDTTYIVNGAVSLDAVKDYFNVKLPVDEYDTLSGFIIGQLGRIPEEDEKPEIVFSGMVFKVEKADEKRITKVKACRAF
jgi:putative hemolysin